MTETGAGAVVIASHEPRHTGANCFGRPQTVVETRIMPEDGELLVRATGPDPHAGFFTAYLSDEAATRAAAVEATRDAATTLVHNAGAIRPALLPDIDTEDLAALSRLHLGAVTILAQAALPAMRAARPFRTHRADRLSRRPRPANP